MRRVVIKEFCEIIEDPISLATSENKIVQHADLPTVKDELSVTLYLKVKSINSNWACIFLKAQTFGTEHDIRTPSLWLWPNKTTMHARFSGNWSSNAGIYETATQLSLNKWHHISYTLSDSEKRLDLYIDCLWIGYYGIEDVQTQKVLFNTGPLHIGLAYDGKLTGITGEISNFRYFNWRLTAEEVQKNFLCELTLFKLNKIYTPLGTENFIRTPSLWLLPNKTTMHARFSGNWDHNTGIEESATQLSLNKWHHISYTLSDLEKRLDLYIDCLWVGHFGIQDVQTQKVLFNTGPLHIGLAFYSGISGEISNFRYFNWRLTAEEVQKNFW
nr:5764_t:CDS:2 [Entrophospora candida]